MGDILLPSREATVELAMDQRVQDMCLLAFRRHLGSLAIVPFLVAMLASPVSAQTNSESSFSKDRPSQRPCSIRIKLSAYQAHSSDSKSWL